MYRQPLDLRTLAADPIASARPTSIFVSSWQLRLCEPAGICRTYQLHCRWDAGVTLCNFGQLEQRNFPKTEV